MQFPKSAADGKVVVLLALVDVSAFRVASDLGDVSAFGVVFAIGNVSVFFPIMIVVLCVEATSTVVSVVERKELVVFVGVSVLAIASSFVMFPSSGFFGWLPLFFFSSTSLSICASIARCSATTSSPSPIEPVPELTVIVSNDGVSPFPSISILFN
eukprot:m.3465 g.3465  ORF g.3465 m.3465 type:complete len:156 (-) comp2073_c0_seq1:68-535(-)